MNRSRIAAFAAAMGLAVLAGPVGSASARVIDPARSAIGNSARLNASATTVHLEGVVYCAPCRQFTLGATVSQAASGAVGQGGVRCVCQGAREHWIVAARAREATRFRRGAARVCVWVIARSNAGKAIDAEQWCESVRLRFAAA